MEESVQKEILRKIESLEAYIKKTKHTSIEILDNQQLMQLLKISPKTAQIWRAKGLIAYSMIGNKVYYNMNDVIEMLNKHRVSL